MGKPKPETLKNILSCIKKTSEILVAPTPGFDSGVHLVGNDRCLVVSTDPCIGVPDQYFGWFLIHYAASDVAVFGASPKYCAINLLAPTKTKPSVFEKVMKQACEAVDEIGAAIITGHTGTYDAVTTLTGTCTAYGIIPREHLITPAGARPGEHVICTKPIGLETLVNFSIAHRKLADPLFGHEKTLELAEKIRMQTCVREALALAKAGVVTAMHDATEGGLVAALNEMADTSHVGFSIDWAELPILPELRRLAKHFRLSEAQVLATSSTGTLLAAVRADREDEAVAALARIGLSPKVVGVFTESKKRLITNGAAGKSFPERADDPYARIMASRGQG